MKLEMSASISIKEEETSALIGIKEEETSALIGIKEEETSASANKEKKSVSLKNVKTSASIKREEHKVKELLIEIMENVEPEPASKCCIYKVPKDIRRVNGKAYTPQSISIGPLHHGKKNLADMQRAKRRYVKSFLNRIPVEQVAAKVDEILSFVQSNEQRIRDCYAATVKLQSSEFVIMVVFDAIFIVEHFVSTCCEKSDDSWPHVPAVQCALSWDLQLLENQLPYFVLDGIYNIVFEEVTFTEVSNRFFKCAFDMDFNDQAVVEHFTDLIRIALAKSYPKGKLKGSIRDLPCALELHESGVKFKNTKGEGLLDVRLKKRKQLLPLLRVHELHIPCLAINDSTESLLRNVMAFEQCHYPLDTRVCNYVRLMDYLINTEKDVELLVAEGIISNLVGDNAEVANMFNRLNNSITPDENSSYHNCCEELKAHYKNPWNKTKATLTGVYFSNLWRGTATFAAVILLVLTVIQAICSIMQVV